MSKIVVVVEGGSVTSVWTDAKTEATVEIVDLDNLAEEHSKTIALRICQDHTEGLTNQY